MKISCTVSEFAKLIRSCDEARNTYDSDGMDYCVSCPLYDICREEGIEQFIKADQITDDVEERDHE